MSNTVLPNADQGRVGDWIQTFSGGCFWPLDPRSSEVDIHDIAQSLAMTPRYRGHTVRFYSVAEHSVLVSRAVPPEYALWGLLHDAAEAYTADIPSPLKRSIAEWPTIERVTPSGRAIVNGRTFYPHGYERGNAKSGWGSTIQPGTPELLERLRGTFAFIAISKAITDIERWGRRANTSVFNPADIEKADRLVAAIRDVLGDGA